MTALATTLATLLIHVPDLSEVHPSTKEAHASHPVAWRWLSGQLWAWDGGDAITVITGGHYGSEDYRVWFFIRLGTEVHALEARSFKDAMEQLGYNTKIDTAYYERLEAAEAEREGSAGL